MVWTPFLKGSEFYLPSSGGEGSWGELILFLTIQPLRLYHMFEHKFIFSSSNILCEKIIVSNKSH